MTADKLRRLPTDTRNCAVLERTADGRTVGRCCFYTEVGPRSGLLVCPRHGDVEDVQRTYEETGRLTDEKDLGR
jgi:hypothetical protein